MANFNYAKSLRESIIDGDYSDYIKYEEPDGNTGGRFYVVQLFAWEADADLTNQDFIQLKAKETFDGQDYEVDLTGLNDFEGLIKVDERIYNFNDAPKIRNVQMRNGETSVEGGSIAKKNTKFARIESCNVHDGCVNGDRDYPTDYDYAGGGGICGAWCGTGEGSRIYIRDCFCGVSLSISGTGGIAG